MRMIQEIIYFDHGTAKKNNSYSIKNYCVEKLQDKPHTFVRFIPNGLSTTNVHEQLFHPLMSFISTSGFMPGKITGTAI